MTKYCDGHPVIVDVICRNHGVELYTRGDTKVEIKDDVYYLCNTYSGYICNDPENVKFHKKLTVYVCSTHGYYVRLNNRRLYINSLMTDAQMKEIGFFRLY